MRSMTRGRPSRQTMRRQTWQLQFGSSPPFDWALWCCSAEFSSRPTRRSRGRKVPRAKAWLTTFATAFAVVQVVTGRRAGKQGAASWFLAKMLSLTWRESMPRWAVPALGGTVFLGLIGVWLTSSLWLCTSKGWHF